MKSAKHAGVLVIPGWTAAIIGVALSLCITSPAASGGGPDAKWLYYINQNCDSIYRFETAALDPQPIMYGLDGTGSALAVHDCKMYWTSGSAIRRCNMDGSNVEALIAAGDVRALAIDSTAAKMYWGSQSGFIHKSNLDGSEIQSFYVDDPVEAMALDALGGKIYWTALGIGVRRANLDGSDIELIAASLGPYGPKGIALDLSAQQVYWTECASPPHCLDSPIRRANLDGSNVEDFLTELHEPNAVIVDSDAGKVYWNSKATTPPPQAPELIDHRFIHRANLDGSQIEIIGWPTDARGFAFAPSNVDTMCVPPPAPCPPEVTCQLGAIYWATGNSAGGTIWRANANGTGIQAIVDIDDLYPMSVTVDGGLGKIYWSNKVLHGPAVAGTPTGYVFSRPLRNRGFG
jgi:hypothetical protein